ncbi:MAG TPA: hypothetical protein VNZ27_10600 [Rhodanobacter sp.]|jgi:hypothetical protein|nr:hypothetical protein [Rhodanobacter sp.]
MDDVYRNAASSVRHHLDVHMKFMGTVMNGGAHRRYRRIRQPQAYLRAAMRKHTKAYVCGAQQHNEYVCMECLGGKWQPYHAPTTMDIQHVQRAAIATLGPHDLGNHNL